MAAISSGRHSLQHAYRRLLQKKQLLPDSEQASLVSRLCTLQQDLSDPPSDGQVKGLYIHGGVGTGKSRIADLFAATLPNDVSRRRVHFHEFMMDVHSRLHTTRSQGHFLGDPLPQIGADIVSRESRVLCFDEFQVTDIADAMLLGRLFAGIWGAGGVLVSTSNRHPDHLYENGLNRDLFLPFLAMLKKRCELWKLSGKEDYRTRDWGEGNQRKETFFVDEDRFQSCLETETARMGDRRQECITIHGGRELWVDAWSGADGRLIVDGTFEHLCEANRGSSDYIALCKRANVIYIRGLRHFRKDELDIVRRFITLIDCAYEARVVVMCLSEVPLAEVFSSIIDPQSIPVQVQNISVRGEGGSSSSMSTTYIGEAEWSATGLAEASLGTGGAGETDVRFAIRRAISRLFEMGSSRLYQ